MIAIPHPINRKIATYNYLSTLIINYPNYVESWLDSVQKEINAKAIEFSEGDREIESDIYFQELRSIYNQTEYEECLFYKSMLIMVYSYYESILNKMAFDVNADNSRPSIICKKKGKSLSKENQKKAVFLYEKVYFLRNHLCHNDSGTKNKDEKKTEAALDWLCQNKCINLDNSLYRGEVCYISKDFILDVLNKEYDVLVELSKIIEYKGFNC